MAKARGASGTRHAIMRSAADLFAELGFGNTSMRAVAADAGCDPALVTHYFASKEALYRAVVEETVRPAEVIREALERGDEGAAEWLLRHAVADWNDPVQRRRILGVLRSASDLPAARERLSQSLLAEGVADGGPDEVRVWLISSLFIGVMTSRHMGLLPPELAEAEGGDELVRALAPVVASYLAAVRRDDADPVRDAS
ncbi:TetR/AcrR family transcriptional regulator [Streptomyces cylindrosporus]|uniref:TetR/AcrR family transcriptional regulator n=1 Tax=Streptomyces cylindrosporus TaxID=2927583 RepID=A0ABS9Y288_9ACTN|nr:TetR/AcrR family transcriptional regulator [Streptomyces cylindrosporus]MCI3271305.1 TetR/AcrR family transcriptional regulator [Streptomyces cylindrosporus]